VNLSKYISKSNIEARKCPIYLSRVREGRFETFMKALGMNKRRTLISRKGLISLHEGRLGNITDITTIIGCENLVPTSPHTASGETSVRILRMSKVPIA